MGHGYKFPKLKPANHQKFSNSLQFSASRITSYFYVNNNNVKIHTLFLLDYSMCKFKDQERGVIKFKGNLLFTHFNEIGVPLPTHHAEGINLGVVNDPNVYVRDED